MTRFGIFLAVLPCGDGPYAKDSCPSHKTSILFLMLMMLMLIAISMTRRVIILQGGRWHSPRVVLAVVVILIIMTPFGPPIRLYWTPFTNDSYHSCDSYPDILRYCCHSFCGSYYHSTTIITTTRGNIFIIILVFLVVMIQRPPRQRNTGLMGTNRTIPQIFMLTMTLTTIGTHTPYTFGTMTTPWSRHHYQKITTFTCNDCNNP